MAHRTMASPLTTEPDDVMTEVGSIDLEPFRDFEFDLQTNRLRVAGYTVAEAGELLRLFREHVMELARFAEAQHLVQEDLS